MVGTKCKRELRSHTAEGKSVLLLEMVKLIDNTDALSKVRPEIVEGGFRWLETEDGLGVSVNAAAGDGSLIVDKTGERLWLDE